MSRHARFTHALCALPRFALVALVACGGGAPPPIAGPAAEGALEVSVSGTVHGSVNGAIVGVRTLKSGDEVVLSVRATRDAFVSVAYCDGRGGLSMFPERGALQARASSDVRIPTGSAAFTLDDTVGSESIYVIVSTRPLDSADPALAAALGRAAGGKATCPTASIEHGAANEEGGKPAAPSASSAAPAVPAASAPGPAPVAARSTPPGSEPERKDREQEGRPQLVATRPVTGARASLAVRGVQIKGDTGEKDVRTRADDVGVAIVRISFEHVR